MLYCNLQISCEQDFSHQQPYLVLNTFVKAILLFLSIYLHCIYFYLVKKDTIIDTAPNKNIKTKSAVLFLNDPSSNILQYRYVNIILKKKLNPNVPKKRNVVTSLHTWPCFRIKIGLK